MKERILLGMAATEDQRDEGKAFSTEEEVLAFPVPCSESPARDPASLNFDFPARDCRQKSARASSTANPINEMGRAIAKVVDLLIPFSGGGGRSCDMSLDSTPALAWAVLERVAEISVGVGKTEVEEKKSVRLEGSVS